MLSGMSTLAQVEDNTAYMQDMKPLTDKERALLRSVKAAYAKTWKFACDDFAAVGPVVESACSASGGLLSFVEERK